MATKLERCFDYSKVIPTLMRPLPRLKFDRLNFIVYWKFLCKGSSWEGFLILFLQTQLSLGLGLAKGGRPRQDKTKAIFAHETIFILILKQSEAQDNADSEEPLEGYYVFVDSPLAIPPKVRSPPYTHVNVECKNVQSNKAFVSVSNICGDLNKGQIPRNPMKHNVFGEPYPFELIRNQTLIFLSKTLPVLKADDTLPKITQILPDEVGNFRNGIGGSQRISKLERQVDVESLKDQPEIREPKKFCDGGGIFCSFYRAIQGDTSEPSVAERREEAGPVRYEGPPTPCPAKVEYATPVFAKNYQGSWRYVVQIPYEGYFTQTVEITRCLQARCHYLDGGCLSSPRWVSLLVAEIFYPNSDDVPTTTTPSIQDFQAYQQYLQKRAGVVTPDPSNTEFKGNKTMQCDGHDEIGCFQVRLYYDWFLIPGSCKCWRPDYFAKYVRRKAKIDL